MERLFYSYYMNIGVFAASSSLIDKVYLESAAQLGIIIASEGHRIVYGGGTVGLMGAMADAALSKGSKVTGVIPEFMHKNGWGHKGIDELIVTHDMSTRKKKIFEISDAIIALPGGIGTLEELTEAITMKQLGLFRGALVILNIDSFYEHFIEFIDSIIEKRFMREIHKKIWSVVSTPREALDVLKDYTDWHDDPLKIARI